jgi:plasmid stability protein
MPSLTLRGIDNETLRWLRLRAAQHGRSLNAELLDLLEVVKADEMAERRSFHAIARGYLRTRARGIRTKSTSKDIVRADRDRDLRR